MHDLLHRADAYFFVMLFYFMVIALKVALQVGNDANKDVTQGQSNFSLFLLT